MSDAKGMGIMMHGMRAFTFRILLGGLLLCLGAGALGAQEAGKTRLVAVPAGKYLRADGKNVQVEKFGLLSTEVTWSQFKGVCDWAARHGYEFEEGIGQANLPAQNVMWYDAVKWCNALSEMAGRQPVYFTDAAQKEVYRKGRLDLTNACVKWAANGFRLPTEAEWEYAYRAGTTTNLYWGNYARSTPVNHEYAVFHEWGTDEIDGGPLAVASKKPNAFGLFDMAGNVEEWVWDRYAINYEGVGADAPKGPDAGPLRVLRGGGFVIDRIITASDRHPTYPFFINCDIGFRVASSDPQADIQALTALPLLPPGPDDLKPFSQPLAVRDVRPDTDEAAAERLFPMLNLQLPAMKEAAAAYEKKDYAGALAALRDILVPRLKASNLEPWMARNVDLKAADFWLGVYKQNRPIRWTGPQADSDNPWSFAADSQLARAFVKTGKAEYRDAYFWMLNDAALRAKPAWNVLTKVERGSLGVPRDNFYSFIGFDAAHPLGPFQDIAWMLKNLPEGQSCEVPPRVLANTLYSAVVDRLAAGFQDDRGTVPNQVWGNALTIVQASRIFPEFKDAPFWEAEGMHRVRNASGTVMADGTDLEPSINYNKGLFELVENLNKFFPDEKARPAWLNELNKRTQYRHYMYVALATPFGSLASIGNGSDEKERPRKMLQEWLDAGKLDGLENNVKRFLEEDTTKSAKVPAPVFNSVALPHGGYYVLRSGWRSDDLFCFMRSSRDGVGHNHPDNNNLQITAYGAYLLIDGGDPNYGNKGFMNKYQWPIIPYFGETEVGSVFNTNNLSVDGLLQGPPAERLPGPTTPWEKPRALRFHTSANFDLMEGRFEGIYYSEKPVSDKTVRDYIADYGPDAMSDVIAYNAKVKQALPREITATHQRMVFFLRQEKFWIVTDLVDGGSQYTQTWHFPPPSEGLNKKDYLCPGFDPNQVRFENDNKRVVTISHYRPNIAILNFTAAPVRYTRHFGDMFPFKGWYSFGIVSDRVPAVTVEGTWNGSAPMVSALVPSKARPDSYRTLDDGLTGFSPRNSDTVSGFAFADKASTVTFQASRAAQRLQAGPVAASAKQLLVREDAKGVLTGAALDCVSFAVNGEERKVSLPNFEFRIDKGEFTITAPIKSPNSFDWKRDNQGRLAPAYE